MRYLTFSKKLVQESRRFLEVKYISPIEIYRYLFRDITFIGWGRKRSGLLGVRFGQNFLTKEDFYLLGSMGFIRSIGARVSKKSPRIFS